MAARCCRSAAVPSPGDGAEYAASDVDADTNRCAPSAPTIAVVADTVCPGGIGAEFEAIVAALRIEPDIVADGLVLPPRELVHKPADDDPLDYYYKPLTARLYRARLLVAIRLLGASRYDSLLEVGFGSGILLPELARHSHRLAGIDVHRATAEVDEMLMRLGLSADLREASLFSMPFRDEDFDALVCLSVLEHLTELDAALTEFHRVLLPGGIAVLGFPVRNPVTDAFFRAVGYNPREIHPSGHRDILSAVRSHSGFLIEDERRYPRGVPIACRCRVV
jgi:SAM-dependent methyltransferase